MRHLEGFLANRSAATAAEYGLIVSLLTVALLAVIAVAPFDFGNALDILTNISGD